jgi:hypothetical protein
MDSIGMRSREFDHWADAVAHAIRTARETGVRQAVEATIDEDGTMGRSWVACRAFRHPRATSNREVAPGATDDTNGPQIGAEGIEEDE